MQNMFIYYECIIVYIIFVSVQVCTARISRLSNVFILQKCQTSYVNFNKNRPTI